MTPPINDRVDMERLLEFSDNDQDFISMLLQTFLEDSDKRIISINNAISANDSVAWKKEAHALRGACQNLGCHQMGDILDSIEYKPENDNAESAGKLLEKLKIEHEITRAAIEAWINS